MTAAVIVISAIPAQTTVTAGMTFLKAMNTTAAMPMKANMIAHNAWVWSVEPKFAPIWSMLASGYFERA